MNVRELKELLCKYPNDMEVVNGRYSDYQVIEPDEWAVISGVCKRDVVYIMRSHKTMSEDNKEQEKQYLALSGN